MRWCLLVSFATLTAYVQSALKSPTFDCEMQQRAIKNMIHSSDRCFFISMDNVNCPLVDGNFTMFSVSMDQMFSGMIRKYQNIFFCNKVLIILHNLIAFRYFLRNKNLQMAFLPFTRLAVLSLTNAVVPDKDTDRESFLYNGLFISFGRIANKTHYEIEDFLTKEVIVFSNINELDSVVDNRKRYERHPLFTTETREFNVSLFHCPPHVIKLDQRMTMDSYDGAEIRFLREITRGWKVNIFDRYFLFDQGDTWDLVADDVETRRAMMGMCSMWLVEEKYRRLELSNYFSHLCGTFLVPKPLAITEASYIYLPLSSELWLCILATLFITASLYFFMYREAHKAREQVVESLSRIFLDVISIATSHGIPKIIQWIPIRLLVISWVLLSLLLGTAYSTKYTSLLTQPRYTKAVDDTKDFIEQGLFWGEVGDRSLWREQFLTSGTPYYSELPNRMINEKDLTDRCKYIPTGRYARYVKILSNSYVTDTETFSSLAHHLRLMKTCVDEHYTVFPFGRNSPYKEYVNRKLGQYTDAGIVQHWFSLMGIKHGKSYMAGLFDKNNAKVRSEARSLEFKNVIGAFYLLGVGLLISMVAFIWELYSYTKRMRLALISASEA